MLETPLFVLRTDCRSEGQEISFPSNDTKHSEPSA